MEAQWSCAVAVCDKYWFCVLRVSVYLDLPLENMVHCAIWRKYIKMTLFVSSVFSFLHEQSLIMNHAFTKKKLKKIDGPSGKSVTHTLSHTCSGVLRRTWVPSEQTCQETGSHYAWQVLKSQQVFPVYLHSWQGLIHSLNTYVINTNSETPTPLLWSFSTCWNDNKMLKTLT